MSPRFPWGDIFTDQLGRDILIDQQQTGRTGLTARPTRWSASPHWSVRLDRRREGDQRMVNDRGLLPKAKREDLPEELRRRLDRWYRDAYEDDNLFLTMARRPGLLDATMGFIRYAYGGTSSIEPELFEIIRVRLAWKNRCVH